MRSITLWLCVLACLLVAAQGFQLPNIEEPDEDVLDELEEDEDVDIARLLGDLFEDEEIDEDDDDDEEVTGRQLATVTGSEQERYNTFMDAFLSQLIRQAKRDLEPLKVTLTSPKKNKKNGKKNGRKNSKKGKKQEKNNNKKDEKNKKQKDKRTPKEINLPEVVTEEVHQIQRREAEAEEEVTSRKANNENKKDKKNKDGENKDEKRGKNRRNKNRDDSKKNRKNNRRQGRSNNKVVLHGLSHIAREGDVKLYNMKKGRALLTEFTIGPVELDVTRVFGSGIDAEERKAAASADQLKGKMMLKVNKKGEPKIKKLSIKRPKDITMSGSVAHNQDNRKVFFKKSVKQVSPTAAKKLLRAAKAIIQTV